MAGLGVPHEQEFCAAYADRLPNVGLIKTSGGLFNFLSGQRSRAPGWMQRTSLEWVWRLGQEPKRLFWRYAMTSPQPLYLLVTRSG
ncbi:MAG: WecB/TagA/CpsF family glycosyltransferase [Hyphomicrobium sp.]